MSATRKIAVVYNRNNFKSIATKESLVNDFIVSKKVEGVLVDLVSFEKGIKQYFFTDGSQVAEVDMISGFNTNHFDALYVDKEVTNLIGGEYFINKTFVEGSTIKYVYIYSHVGNGNVRVEKN
jgi:hypothetical protein